MRLQFYLQLESKLKKDKEELAELEVKIKEALKKREQDEMNNN